VRWMRSSDAGGRRGRYLPLDSVVAACFSAALSAAPPPSDPLERGEEPKSQSEREEGGRDNAALFMATVGVIPVQIL
jgi:hypothetical protein